MSTVLHVSEFVSEPIPLSRLKPWFTPPSTSPPAGSDQFTEVLLKPVKARHLGHALTSRLNRSRRLRELIGSTGGRDPVTGLFSRGVLLDKLAIAAGDRSAALMCIALDRSQALRESIGISGLAALDTHVGQLLRSQLDSSDLAAHYQDFHYFVLVHRSSRSEVTVLAEEIRAQLSRQGWLYNGKDLPLTASIESRIDSASNRREG